ncbi:MAG: DUF423 domain-containing protein [Proteobacteria bacterium]|nr:DUF423 domain-containing protein [Pseudomonadota bacterium]
MSRSLIAIASANGFLAVTLGAFAAHGMEDILSTESLATFQTGVEYHMYHALALFGSALLALHYPQEQLPRRSAYLFLLGILFFSGSLYILCLSGIGWVGAITPIGGLFFLAGWATLFWFGVSSKPKR